MAKIRSLREQLEQEKLRYTEERRLRVEIENRIKTKELLPAELVRKAVAAFNAAIVTNILTIPGRHEKGNKTRREALAKEIKRSLEKANSEIEKAMKAYL